MDDGLNWIGNCLPDVPTHVQDESKPQVLNFKSCFVGTLIIVELSNGMLQVTSDNLSVITIIKDQISQISNAKKITLEVDADILDASWQRNLALLHPMIQEQYSIAQKNQLIDGLKELSLQEEDVNFMSDDYKEILRNADKIRAQFLLQPRKLTYMWGIIADLYMDTAKIKGRHNVQTKMPQLKQLLNNYNFE